jgi:hypothetical protein
MTLGMWSGAFVADTRGRSGSRVAHRRRTGCLATNARCGRGEYQPGTRPSRPRPAALPGSVDIVVQHANRHGKLLVSDPNNNPLVVTFTIGQDTKLRLKNGASTITDGDRGAIRVRAARLAIKGATQDEVVAALASQPAHMVTDWGPPPTS